MTIADTFNVVLHVFLSILRLVFYMSENIICHWMIWVSMSLGELQRAGGVQLSQPPYELCHRSTVSCQQGTTHTICTMLLPLHPQAYPTLPPSLPTHSSEEVILFHQKMNSFFSKYVLCTPSVTITSRISQHPFRLPSTGILTELDWFSVVITYLFKFTSYSCPILLKIKLEFCLFWSYW